MTLTENLDLRQLMSDTIDELENAIQCVVNNDFEGAIELWENGRKKATTTKIKLVLASLLH